MALPDVGIHHYAWQESGSAFTGAGRMGMGMDIPPPVYETINRSAINSSPLVNDAYGNAVASGSPRARSPMMTGAMYETVIDNVPNEPPPAYVAKMEAMAMSGSQLS